MSYCIDMHTKEARKAGETEQRLYGLSAWRETPFYTERERAALAWTEALTMISENDVPDSLYEPTREHFNEEDLISLTMTIVVINGWNRLAISFRTESGSYEVEKISCGFHRKSLLQSLTAIGLQVYACSISRISRIIWLVNPHSLSYQVITLSKSPSTTRVMPRSTIEANGLFMISEETRGSVVTANTLA